MAWISGTINGNSIEGHATSLVRQHHICNPCQVATLTLASSFTSAAVPGDEVVLFENGTKVMTGYVVKTIKDAVEGTHIIEIHDTYHRVSMTFIEDKITTGYDENDQPIVGYDPQSTAYWIGYLCGLAGISYAIDSGASYLVPAGVQFGLRTVHESLLDVLAYSSQACYVDANGTLRFLRVTRNIASRTFTECTEINDSTGDEMTRNVIKVFGYQGVTNRIFAVDSSSVEGVVPDRVAAVGSPMIQTDAEASRVARFLVGELGVQTRVVSIRIPGDPTITLAAVARINFETTDYTDAVTSIDSTITQNGYTTVVTIGERCPRISGWSTELLPVYAGTSGSGVYKSTDSGATWVEFNSGLPAGKKFVKRLAFNSLDEGMAIVNSSLYHTSGSTWSIRSLPAPINMAGDSPAPGYGTLQAVSAKGSTGEFCVLTTNVNSSGSDVQQCRSWVYESTGSGANTWESTQLYDTDTGLIPGDSTGSGYHIYGYDVSSEAGVPYIVASSGSLYSYLPGALVLKGSMERMGILYSSSISICGGDFGGRGVLDYYVTDMRLTGDGVFEFRKLFIDFYWTWNDSDMAYMVFQYKIFGNSDLSMIDLGPWAVGGIPPFTPELTAPASPPWPFAATYHVATLQIREIDISPFGSPFVVAFRMFSASRIDVNNNWGIWNGEPRTCSEYIAQNPDGEGTTRDYINCGFIVYQFEPVS